VAHSVISFAASVVSQGTSAATALQPSSVTHAVGGGTCLMSARRPGYSIAGSAGSESFLPTGSALLRWLSFAWTQDVSFVSDNIGTVFLLPWSLRDDSVGCVAGETPFSLLIS
jgi:hypothetical protein